MNIAGRMDTNVSNPETQVFICNIDLYNKQVIVILHSAVVLVNKQDKSVENQSSVLGLLSDGDRL